MLHTIDYIKSGPKTSAVLCPTKWGGNWAYKLFVFFSAAVLEDLAMARKGTQSSRHGQPGATRKQLMRVTKSMPTGVGLFEPWDPEF